MQRMCQDRSQSAASAVRGIGGYCPHHRTAAALRGLLLTVLAAAVSGCGCYRLPLSAGRSADASRPASRSERLRAVSRPEDVADAAARLLPAGSTYLLLALSGLPVGCRCRVCCDVSGWLLPSIYII